MSSNPTNDAQQAFIRPTSRSLSTVPSEPGVYKMLGDDGTILYIGKAKNLKKRVTSYFVSTEKKDVKTQLLVGVIRYIDILVTQNEDDALLLESRLIKKYQPKYNILLKDDKSYPYIKITKEPFPKIVITRQKRKDGAQYFGPYPSIGSTRYILRTLGDIFPIRDCSQQISLNNIEPKCINLDIGRCIGPCIYKQCKSDYDDHIQSLTLLLNGRNKQLLRDLNTAMTRASHDMNYEKAARIRDRLQKIEQLIEQRHAIADETANYHVWCHISDDDIDYVLVQHIEKGVLLSQRGFYQSKKGVSETHDFLSQTFLQFFDDQNAIPDEILADTSMLEIITSIQHMLKNPWSIPIHMPQKGKKKESLDLTRKNASLAVLRLKKEDAMKQPVETTLLKTIQKTFQLTHLPYRIIGCDISHLQGKDIVASAVYFLNGKPHKKGYRSFKIRSYNGKSNDPGSLYETVKRRLERVDKDNEELPTLWLIDGGKGQLNFAKKAIDESRFSADIDVLSLAKRDEEIYAVGKKDPIRLKRTDQQLMLFQRIRDEAHRFAVTLQRKQRRKYVQNSLLLQIDGVGPKRINDIYKKYKTLDALRNVSANELATVGNMGKKIAHTIIDTVNDAFRDPQ